MMATVFTGNRAGGAVNVTRETITNKSTLGGILGFTQVRALLRLLVIALGIVWALLVGRWAGPLLVVVAALQCLKLVVDFDAVPVLDDDGTMQRKTPRVSVSLEENVARIKREWGVIVGMFVGGLILSGVALTGAWPAYQWVRVGGALYFEHDQVMLGSLRLLRVGSHAVAPLVQWLRWVYIAALPWIITPLSDAEWALRVETYWPKIREAGAAPADPGSITAPAGLQLHSTGKPERVAAPTTPAPSPQVVQPGANAFIPLHVTGGASTNEDNSDGD